MPGQGLGKLKEGAGVAKNQLLHRLFDTPSPCLSETFAEKIVPTRRSRDVIIYHQPYSRREQTSQVNEMSVFTSEMERKRNETT